MTACTTLRRLTGQSDVPAPLSDSALIIVDAQNTYRDGIMALDGIEAALDRCAELLARARALGIPVIHIQHDAGVGTPYDIRAAVGAIADKVAPREGEPVIVKHYPNAFVGTDLDARLKALAPSQVVVAGFMTHMCINSTARGAFSLGHRVAVAADTTATRPLPSLEGGVVAAAEVQTVALAALADLFAAVVPRQADIAD